MFDPTITVDLTIIPPFGDPETTQVEMRQEPRDGILRIARYAVHDALHKAMCISPYAFTQLAVAYGGDEVDMFVLDVDHAQDLPRNDRATEILQITRLVRGLTRNDEWVGGSVALFSQKVWF